MIPPTPSPQSEQVELLFERLPAPWVLGLIIVPGLLLLAWYAYRRPSRPVRPLLTGLRALILGVAVVLLLGPYLRTSTTRTEPAPLALLVDDSASLQRRDALESGALERLAAANLSQEAEPQRLALARKLLESGWRTQLEERYQLQSYRFAERLIPAATDGSDLTGEGRRTAIGEALLSILREHRGRRLPDVVLVSDGRSNFGTAIEEAAGRLAAEGVRVDAVGLGDPRPAPDLALERIRGPEVVLVDDEAVFLLRLTATGDDLPASSRVVLLDETGRELDSAQVPIGADGGTQFPLSARLRDPGERRLVAKVEPLPRETARDNNSLDLVVEVKPVRIRVLYVDGRPRYEYRFLKNRLLRTDRDVTVRAWLADAGRDFLQETSQGLLPLRRVPTTSEELLEEFDVVIIGDVDPTAISPDPLDGARFLEAVAEFVSRGGGLLMLAGPRHNPSAYVGSPVEPLLPVVLSGEPGTTTAPFQPLPADPRSPHPVTLLDTDPQRSELIWSKVLTPLHWYQPVETVRPGAQTWLVNPNEENRHGKRVLAAGGYSPEGWVGWLGTDETWRWRDPVEERYLALFWRSVLRNIAAGRLRGDKGRARLDVDRTRIELGEPVLVEARVRDEAYQPLVEEDGINVYVEERGTPVHLSHLPEEPGRYRGRFRPGELGPLSLVLTDDGSAEGEILASARLTVNLPSAEMRITAQDTAALEALCERTGGRLVPIDRANDLLDALDGRERLTRTLASQDVPLDGRTALLVFLVLAAAEWLLRKRMNLS